MKKYMKVFLVVFLFFLSIYIYIRFTSSYTPSYPSIKAYIKDNSASYYDFYDIDYYLNKGEKKTLSEINKLKVWYHIDPKDNYNITISKDDFEITYMMSAIEYLEEELKNKELVDETYLIYLEKDDGFASVSHFTDDHRLLTVSIRDISKKYDQSSLEQALIELMRDSIYLNTKK